jgi:hypothetical protein
MPFVDKKTQSKRAAIIISVVVLLTMILLGVRLGPVMSKPAPIDGIKKYPNLVSEVVDGEIEYKQIPPAGGQHAAQIQNCGIYDQAIEDANAVASLARGAVWIAYDPQLSPPNIERLRMLARDNPYVLIAPHENLADKVVMTAWGVQISSHTVADSRFVRFVGTYANNEDAPQAGLPCQGGVGTPIEVAP